MEKVVHDSQYAIATFDEEKELYTLEYLPETENMSDEDWKQLMRNLLIVTNKYKPKYIIDNNRSRLYGYPPEMQAWTLELFIPSWNENGLKKYVQILPEDFIAHLSGEQIVELANFKFSEIFENKFVEDMESALEWIKE